MGDLPIPRTPLGVVITAAVLAVLVWFIYASGLWALASLVFIFVVIAFFVYVVLVRIYRLAVYGSIRSRGGGN